MASDLSSVTGAIKRTALSLGAMVKDFKWAQGERAGPIVAISVSDVARGRALRIADALLRAAAAINWGFEADPPKEPPYRSRWTPPEPEQPQVGRLVVEGEPFRFRIDERNRQVPHVLTEREQLDKKLGRWVREPPWDLQATGDLRVHFTNLDGQVFTTRKDSRRAPLDTQILGLLHDLLNQANLEKRRREEKRLADEAERERERLEFLAQERREAHAKLVRELERQAGAWYRARFLRRYIRAARHATNSRGVPIKLLDETVDFYEWAAAYVEQLDPLSPTPRHPDQLPERTHYYRADEEALKKSLLRLFGHDGHLPWKLKAATAVESDDDADDADAFDEDD
jgi:hypothetical protein